MNDLITALGQMLTSPLMQRAYIVAVLVGLSAPVVGTYLVQRGLALLGDGIGHIALTGVALGWIAGAAANVTPHDAWAVPGASGCSSAAARKSSATITSARALP